MNGVCVKWVGWIDLETLSGKARLLFDEEQAKVRYDGLRWRVYLKHRFFYQLKYYFVPIFCKLTRHFRANHFLLILYVT